ncbi:MAG TPA: hypothetical protein DEF41_01860 [Desulfovibrio sp.]|uniref:Uncharacterized protein n=1 Tax=Nitratidesulfovibrio vulgaris (strain ATCC 29579 / DSM 644 / CCUG 34227 / NCIMB 8303 / VKM B-1760 / Hildenborough) TaxID=882 RepID=Q72G44_NITV2|nr:hypothetical protein DVU_0016 [Nitratidesulfovibrio vulgaris str. Hildenborough]HBW14899.1 hypothetical protein [Desulfovibrio sp.]
MNGCCEVRGVAVAAHGACCSHVKRAYLKNRKKRS